MIGHLFVGDTDPTMTETVLQGDLWSDTTGGPPYVLRSYTGGEWIAQPLIVKDAEGNPIATVAIDPDGRIVASGPGAGLGIDADGHINVSTPTAGFDVSASGGVRVDTALAALVLANGNVTLDLPTSDPAVFGALYSDAGTVKVSAG